MRVSIDLKLMVGHWYEVVGRGLQRPDLRIRNDLVDVPVRPGMIRIVPAGSTVFWCLDVNFFGSY